MTMSDRRIINVDFALNGPQRMAFEAIAPRQTISLPWGRGVGKSWFVRNVAWLLVAQNYGKLRQGSPKPLRGIRIVALMDTHKHFKDVHATSLQRELEEDWGWLGGKVNKTTLRVDFPDGSWFQPFPADQHTSKSALGLRCDVVIPDECDDIPISVFDTVVRPWFSEPWSHKIRLAAGTPRKGRHGLLYHLHKLGQSDDPKHERYHSFHATYRDAPETVDPEEVEDARENSPPAVFAREWECNFDAAEGLVYGDVFDERFHVVADIPPEVVWSSILIGGDHGYEDPGVLLLIGIRGHGRDAEAWVIDEIYQNHQIDDWWEDRLREWHKIFPHARLYYDTAAASVIKGFKKNVGIKVASEVDKSIIAGIGTVANLFHIRGEGEKRKARLYIHERCKFTIWELGAYKRRQDPHDPDRYLEDIVDKDNHAMDALRYALHNHFGPLLQAADRSYGSVEARQ
jgi:hypothetical protein